MGGGKEGEIQGGRRERKRERKNAFGRKPKEGLLCLSPALSGKPAVPTDSLASDSGLISTFRPLSDHKEWPRPPSAKRFLYPFFTLNPASPPHPSPGPTRLKHGKEISLQHHTLGPEKRARTVCRPSAAPSGAWTLPQTNFSSLLLSSAPEAEAVRRGRPGEPGAAGCPHRGPAPAPLPRAGGVPGGGRVLRSVCAGPAGREGRGQAKEEGRPPPGGGGACLACQRERGSCACEPRRPARGHSAPPEPPPSRATPPRRPGVPAGPAAALSSLGQGPPRAVREGSTGFSAVDVPASCVRARDAERRWPPPRRLCK